MLYTYKYVLQQSPNQTLILWTNDVLLIIINLEEASDVSWLNLSLLTGQFFRMNGILPPCTAQCCKVIDSWDSIFVCIVTLGTLISLGIGFLVCKAVIIIVYIPTTLGLVENSSSSKPVPALYPIRRLSCGIRRTRVSPSNTTRQSSWPIPVLSPQWYLWW